MTMLAQVDHAAHLAEKAIDKASSGEILIAVLVLIVVAGLGALHWWFVVIPDRRATRAQTEKLVEAVAALCPATAGIHETTEKTHRAVGRAERALRPAVRIMEKIAEVHPDLKLSGEIGQMKGALGDDT